MPVIWLIAGVLLAVAELFTLDFVLIMLAAGALAAALAGAVGAPLSLQLLVFAIVSILGLAAIRPMIKRRLHRHAEPAPVGIAALEGAEATVVEQVAQGQGMIKIGGELWTARPIDTADVIEPGALVRVVEVIGATALVSRG